MSIHCINEFPVEIRQKIFSMLPGMHATIVQVCKDWYKEQMDNIQIFGVKYLLTPEIQQLLPDADAPRTDIELIKYVKKITRFFKERYDQHPEIDQHGKPILLPPGPLEPTFLQFLIQQASQREQISDQNLATLFYGLRERHPDLPEFSQNLSIVEQATRIRDWMNKNRARLNLITAIDLPSHGLTEIPAEIQVFTNLQTLSLNRNKITVIPPWIGHFERLYSIDLSDNQISIIPPEIGALKKLLFLYLSDNRITNIPLEFHNLNSLMTVDLIDNRLTTDAQAIIEKFWCDNRERKITL